MSAPEFCREIRNDDRTRSISLLLVCDRENGEHQDLCLAAGCNDVIFRPLQRHDLDSKITRLTTIPTRRELRTLTRIEVSLEKNGRFLIGRSLNISSTGMLLELDRVLPGEGQLRLHFYLPGESQPLQVDAEVLRAEFAGTLAKYGLHFMHINEEERERIDRFVVRLRSRELI
jgi:CheY-like chemotaxis protein